MYWIYNAATPFVQYNKGKKYFKTHFIQSHHLKELGHEKEFKYFDKNV